MPHFFHNAKHKEYLSILNSIPSNELVLLDKDVNGVDHTMAVYQNFKLDIYHALVSTKERVKKYHQIKMVFPDITHHPVEIIEGVKEFCNKTKMSFSVIRDLENEKINSGTLYIVIEDPDLAKLIKKVRTTKFELGKQVGIISFNETDLKELLNITVITTDFQQMGESVGNMILRNQPDQLKNPFQIIVRTSL
jgi:DNA-binding LacI/PurR family transcriptional regulator